MTLVTIFVEIEIVGFVYASRASPCPSIVLIGQHITWVENSIDHKSISRTTDYVYSCEFGPYFGIKCPVLVCQPSHGTRACYCVLASIPWTLHWWFPNSVSNRTRRKEMSTWFCQWLCKPLERRCQMDLIKSSLDPRRQRSIWPPHRIKSFCERRRNVDRQ